jgi:hypothetical protein
MSSRSRSLAPVGSTSGGPVGRDGDRVKVLRSGNRYMTGRGVTCFGPMGEHRTTEIVGQRQSGNISPSLVDGDGAAAKAGEEKCTQAS